MNTVNLPSPILSVFFFSVSNVLQFMCPLYTYFFFNFRFFISSFRYLTVIHKKSHFRALIIFVTLSLVILMAVLPVAGTVTGCVQILCKFKNYSFCFFNLLPSVKRE